MKANEFKNVEKQAVECGNVATNQMFGSAGYLWMNLTEKQVNKMIDIMEAQGSVADAEGWYKLSSGMTVRRKSLM